METGELTGGGIAIIAASVSALSAIVTALVTNVLTHWSAVSRERRSRNDERLSNLVIDFLQDFKVFQLSFKRWSKLYLEILELKKEEPKDQEAQKKKDQKIRKLYADWHSEFSKFQESSDRLGGYSSGLDVYAPVAVRDAYNTGQKSASEAVDLAIKGNASGMSKGMSRASKQLEASRLAIAEAVRGELKVKSRVTIRDRLGRS